MALGAGQDPGGRRVRAWGLVMELAAPTVCRGCSLVRVSPTSFHPRRKAVRIPAGKRRIILPVVE